MKIIKFLFALALTVSLAWVCNNQLVLESMPNAVPPLGKLLNPFTGFWQNAESPYSFPEASIDAKELIAPVMVRYDEKMVPHIFAHNMEDALFVQGYVTAQNRLWQMDFSARFGSGRLSEVLGAKALDIDRLQRRKGMLLAAENTVREWEKNKADIAFLDAFTAGVNAYIATLRPKDYPLEFKLLDYKPEPWSRLHAALILKNMSQTLCGRENDLEATNTLQLFGRETFDFLFPEYNPKEKPVIPAGTPWEFDPVPITDNPPVEESIGFLPHTPLEKPDKSLGSNNWAVAGSKTASGNPILCSDPHLRLTLPSVWYEMQIHTPEMNAYGVTLPGLPGIIIGFNENIAWGQTNVAWDVLDWYQIKWTDETKEKYWLDGEEKAVQKVVNVFKVRGQEEPVRDTVKMTVWGPVVYEDANHPSHDLAMRWLAHDQSSPEELSVFRDLNTGKNYDDYSDALLKYVAPAQNYAFAAKDGDIALKVDGRFPLKTKEQGRFVQDGSRSANAWHGFIPMTHVPQVKNPPRGFVASANQRSTDQTYPYYYNGGFADYRGRYIVRRLSEMDSITVEDMMALQTDSYSLFAEENLPLLLERLDTADLGFIQKQALKKLRAWDYTFRGDDITPVLFTEWWDAFYHNTWDEMAAVQDSMPVLYPEYWRVTDLLDTLPNAVFFDIQATPKVENAGDIVTQSFVQVCDSLELKLTDPTYNWAKHKATIVSHLGRIPAFSSDILQIGGYRYAPNAISQFNGPSWRMVVELGDEVKAWGVYPGGQSGNPGSPYYDSMLEKWANGAYYELFFMKNEDDDRQEIRFSQKFF
ncbi:MAG: penicillin acylase family protein [Bacteroidetes bacterium]|nr:MAG: penicillin acylase family protein [Bacteroidota bacterium]